MDDHLKARIEAEARANRLASVRRHLLRAWIDVRTFSGLESLGPPVEDAVDAVSEALRVVADEAKDGTSKEERLREALRAAREKDREVEVDGVEVD